MNVSLSKFLVTAISVYLNIFNSYETHNNIVRSYSFRNVSQINALFIWKILIAQVVAGSVVYPTRFKICIPKFQITLLKVPRVTLNFSSKTWLYQICTSWYFTWKFFWHQKHDGSLFLIFCRTSNSSLSIDVMYFYSLLKKHCARLS
jgi:hypothetical protein